MRSRATWLIPYAAAGVLSLALGQRSSGARRCARLARENESGARDAQLRRHVLSSERGPRRDHAHRAPGQGRATSPSGCNRWTARAASSCATTTSSPVICPISTPCWSSRARTAGPFLGSLPRFGADVDEFYLIESLPASRVLGRPARVIAVNPKDQFRFGYRLWLDENTAMPLKTQLCDAHGQVIEQILFARLEMPETIADADLAPAVHTEGMRWVRQGPSSEPASAALSAYRASELPPGFHLTVSGAQTLGGCHGSRRPLRVLGRAGDGVGVRGAGSSGEGQQRRCAERAARAAHAGTGPSRLRVRILHRRAGPSGHRGGRGSGADGRVHRALGEVLRQQQQPAAALNHALRALLAPGLRPVRGDAGRARSGCPPPTATRSM